MKIKNIDHIVISVSDIKKSIEFYVNILGMEHENSGSRHVVRFGNQKINLHVGKAQFSPAAKNPEFGSTDVCFIAEGDIYDIKKEIESKNQAIEEGVVRRIGAVSIINSIYLRDPDGNLIEISTPA